MVLPLGRWALVSRLTLACWRSSPCNTVSWPANGSRIGGPDRAEAGRTLTYVLFSSLALILLFTLWQPMGGVIWSVEDSTGRLLLRALFAFGWGLVLVSTFLINHFDLFGLRQVWYYLLGRPCSTLRFGTPGPYRLVRHPLYVGWLFAFWMTPVMTLAHLLFSIATTAYILLAIQFEERDLGSEHGDAMKKYRRSVPMLVPFVGKREVSPDWETLVCCDRFHSRWPR